MFSTEFSKELTRKLDKFQRKNKVLFDAIIDKMREIKENPEHYKPLRHDMKGLRRVHIMKSFVLIFRIDQTTNKIIFEDFDHHDEVYRR